MSNSITALKIDTDGKASPVTLTLTGANALKSVCDAIDEACTAVERVICHPDTSSEYDFQMWVNEDGWAQGAKVNPAATMIVSASNPDRSCPQICGAVIVTGAEGRVGEVVSLHETTTDYLRGVLSMVELTTRKDVQR